MVCTPIPNVSALLPQVETEDRFEWIGGSSIGGGTFWGLGALLTKTKVILFRTSALWPLVPATRLQKLFPSLYPNLNARS